MDTFFKDLIVMKNSDTLSRNGSELVIRPKIISIKRKQNQGFGFTLRHFIAYLPDEICHSSGQAMESIFVKDVNPYGPAYLAGLKKGDRLLKVNNIQVAGLPYSVVVSEIKQTPFILELQIVPKECDVLQMCYTDIAHNPETNRKSISNELNPSSRLFTPSRSLLRRSSWDYRDRKNLWLDEQKFPLTIKDQSYKCNKDTLGLREPYKLENSFAKSNREDVHVRLGFENKIEKSCNQKMFNNEAARSEIHDNLYKPGYNKSTSNTLPLPSKHSEIKANNTDENKIFHRSDNARYSVPNQHTLYKGFNRGYNDSIHSNSFNTEFSKLYSDNLSGGRNMPPICIQNRNTEKVHGAIPKENLNEFNPINSDNFNIRESPIKTIDVFKENDCHSIGHIRRRIKTNILQNNKPVRRISYLRATGNESDSDERIDINEQSTTNNSSQETQIDVQFSMVTFQSEKWYKASVNLHENILAININCNPPKNFSLFNLDLRDFEISTDYKFSSSNNILKLVEKSNETLGASSKNDEINLRFQNEQEFRKWLGILSKLTYSKYNLSKDNSMHGKQQAEPQQMAALTIVQTSILGSENNQSNSSSSGSVQKLISSTLETSDNQSFSDSKLDKGQTIKVVEKEAGSPKTKNWKDLLFRKIQGNHLDNSINTTNQAIKGNIGVPLNNCPMSKKNEYVPYIVDICTEIVEKRGLNIVGIYRVPGNKAAISELRDEVNKVDFSPDSIEYDSRWEDVNVVSSLLKLFIRSLPDALLPNSFYNDFIEADKKIGDNRLRQIKQLLKSLPPCPYETLKHIIKHLNCISKHCEINLMEPSNLAIIFGPSIIRTPNETLEMAFKDMKHKYRIVELLVSQYTYFFEDGTISKFDDNLQLQKSSEEHHKNLLSNVSKIENKFSSKDFVSSRFIPHLKKRNYRKRSVTASASSDTCSSDTASVYKEQTIDNELNEASKNLNKINIQDKIIGSSFSEENTNYGKNLGSLSLAGIMDTLDKKLRNLRNSQINKEDREIERLNKTFRQLQPLTLGENIPFADESPERLCLQSQDIVDSKETRKTLFQQINERDTKYNNISITKQNHIYDNCSDDSEVSTTSDPREIIFESTIFKDKLRKRKNNKLFRSASFNCRNSSTRINSNNPTLTKDEKTDMNITKKRQSQNKQSRSIKRRHTVGGPQDFYTIIRKANNEHILEVGIRIKNLSSIDANA